VLATERRERIRAALQESGVISTEQLARDLDVSLETVRRDLVLMQRHGELERVHGGATAGARTARPEASFTDRACLAVTAKRDIGRAGAALVRPGQTLALDVGTTALQLARALPRDYYGTVATCSLLVATELAGRRDIEVLVSGGRVRGGDLSLSNAQTVKFFADLRPDIAFLGSGGVDVVNGLTDFHLDEVATRRVIIANSARSYVLADSAKIGQVAPHRVCRLADLDGLITDRSAPEHLADAVEQAGGEIIVAHPDTSR
jgi:DeoR family fructose operon transcriptional repressor